MAVVLAGASIAWFFWGRSSGVADVPLLIGAGLGVALTMVAALVTARTAGASTMSQDPAARRVYWIALVAEVIAALAGASLLVTLGHPSLVIAWVLAVMGAHFIPLGRAFHAPVLFGTAAVCMLVAIVAAVAELWYGFPAPPIAGGLGGLTLLVSSAVALVVAATRQAPVSA